MRAKPRRETNNEAIESIREKLGLSQQEFSLAIGFMTYGGYNAALRHVVSNQLLLAAEGLAANHQAAHPAAAAPVPARRILLTISSDGVECEAYALGTALQTLYLNSVAYLLVPDRG